MTPELMEFRRWGIVASLIERYTEEEMEPVVLNDDGIEMLLVHKDKAFFFSSYPQGSIGVETWEADTDQILTSDWLFPIPMRENLTLSEVAHVSIAKVLS